MFKVGDYVYHSFSPSINGKIFKIDKNFIYIKTKKHGFLAYNSEVLIHESIYNSPLYQAMNERTEEEENDEL